MSKKMDPIDTYHHDAGKGSIPRPTNHEQYKSNYDLIFGKKDKTNDATTHTRVKNSQES
jgi:hypothetical protein